MKEIKTLERLFLDSPHGPKWPPDKESLAWEYEWEDSLKKLKKLSKNIHNLLAFLRKDVDLIDKYYKGYGNEAPGNLYRSYMKEIEEGLK